MFTMISIDSYETVKKKKIVTFSFVQSTFRDLFKDHDT